MSNKTYRLTNSPYYSLEKTINQVILKDGSKEDSGLLLNEIIVLPNRKVLDKVKSYLSNIRGDFSTSNLTTADGLIQDILGYLRAETGINNDFSLTEIGKKHLIKRIVSEIKQDIEQSENPTVGRYLSRLVSPAKFIKDVSSLIGTLKASYHKLVGGNTRGAFEFNKIQPLLRKLHRNKMSTEKFTDIEEIIQRYEKQKQLLNLKDKEDMLIQSINHLREAPKLDSVFLRRIERIRICGVHMLSYINIDFLDVMADNLDCDLCITIFEGQSNTHIIDYLNEIGFSRESAMVFDSTLHNLSNSLFDDESETSSNIDINEIPQKLNLIECSVLEDEVIAVCKKIKQLLREGKAEPEDILIVSSQLPLYRNIIRSTMEKMGVDIFISVEESLDTQKLVYILLTILELKLNRFQYTDFIKLIKSNYLFDNKKKKYTKDYPHVIEEFFTDRKVDDNYFIEQMEAYLRKAEHNEENHNRYRIEEISRAIEYAKKIKEVFFPSNNEDSLLPPPDKAVDFYEISNGYKKVIEEELGILYNVFNTKTRIDEKDYYTEEELTIAKRDSFVFSKFLNLIEEMGFYYNLMGEKLNLREFYASLKQRLPEVKFSEDTDPINKVPVYDVNEASTMKFKYVFMLGMLENGFPRKHSTNVYISEKEKAEINHHAGFKIMSSVDDFYNKEEDIFKMILDIPKESITLSFPMEEEGKPTLKSFYIDEILETIRISMGEEKTIEDVKSLLSINIPDAVYYKEEFIEKTIKQYQNQLSRVLYSSNDMFKAEFKEKLEEVKNNISNGINIEKDYLKRIIDSIFMESARESLHYTEYDGNLLYEENSLSDGEKEEVYKYLEYIFSQTSPTYLEMFGECPIRFFFNKVLNIKEPEKVDEVMDARLKGTTVHYILERFYMEHVKDRLAEANESNKDSIKAELLQILDDIIKEEFLRLNEENKIANGSIFNLNQMRFIRRKLAKYFDMDFDLLYEKKYTPQEFEFSFGRKHEESAEPLHVYDDKGQLMVKIGGSIDRIDVPTDLSPDTTIKLSDYKTGSSMSKKNIITLISEGRKFQPALYCMKVMETELNGITPDKLIWCYQYVFDPKKYPEFEIEKESDLIHQTVEHIKEYRDKILKGMFYLAPKESSEYCKYRYACGYVKYKTEEKGDNSAFWDKH